MYGGGYLFEKTNVSELDDEDQEKVAIFEARIDRG